MKPVSLAYIFKLQSPLNPISTTCSDMYRWELSTNYVIKKYNNKILAKVRGHSSCIPVRTKLSSIHKEPERYVTCVLFFHLALASNLKEKPPKTECWHTISIIYSPQRSFITSRQPKPSSHHCHGIGQNYLLTESSNKKNGIGKPVIILIKLWSCIEN